MIRTLIVEDDPVASAAHAEYVGRVRGFEVVAEAPTGADALRVLARGGLDLVLLDVHLPDTNGLEVLRRMRAAGNTTDVIMVTQARDLAVVRAAIAFGATQYLVKPFTSGAVRAKLEGYLAYRDRLAAGRPIAQDDVDGLFDALRAPVRGGRAAQDRQPGDARRGGRRAAPGRRGDGGRGRGELGMSRVTARRYLEHLVDAGLAVREPRYGGTGRPQLEYSWRPTGVPGYRAHRSGCRTPRTEVGADEAGRRVRGRLRGGEAPRRGGRRGGRGARVGVVGAADVVWSVPAVRAPGRRTRSARLRACRRRRRGWC